jgi:predicted NBD/HSP70 family sugar kinase
VRAHDVRRRNIAAVVRALATRGPTPRTELAEILRVSPGTVTRIAAELAAAGLLRELPARPSADVGRRRVPLQLRADEFAAVGVHIGPLRASVGLVDLRGALIGGPLQVSRAGHGPREVIAASAEAARRLITGRRVRIVGTGICVAGAVAPDRRDGLPSFDGPAGPDGSAGSDGAAAGVRGVRPQDRSEAGLARLAAGRFPPPLAIDSSHRALARAELRFGGAYGTGCFAHLFVGTVVEAGLVLGADGHGAGGFAGPVPRAADVAHLPLSRPAYTPCHCGRTGCLTSVAGDRALGARAAAERLAPAGDPAAAPALRHLVRRAEAGDRTADYLLRERARAVGEAVAVLVDLFAPDRVFLSGSPLLVPGHMREVRAEAARRSQAPLDAGQVIVPSGLSRQVRVVAAATSALERFYDDPARALTCSPPPSGDLV